VRRIDVKAALIKRDEARAFGGGAEHCREYLVSDRITFGSSSIEPGETGPIDWGHQGATEVWFVVKGRASIRTPRSEFNDEAVYDLEEGDVLAIPENVPHELTNTGSCTALLSWSLAPGI